MFHLVMIILNPVKHDVVGQGGLKREMRLEVRPRQWGVRICGSLDVAVGVVRIGQRGQIGAKAIQTLEN